MKDIVKKKWRLGYRDGSGASTIVTDDAEQKPLVVAWSEKGCGCCAIDADANDLKVLLSVVEAHNAALAGTKDDEEEMAVREILKAADVVAEANRKTASTWGIPALCSSVDKLAALRKKGGNRAKV